MKADDLVQGTHVLSLLRILGRKTRHSSMTRRPEIYTEAVSVEALLDLLLWLCVPDSGPNNDVLVSRRVFTYLDYHMRPEDYMEGPAIDQATLIRNIAEEAQQKAALMSDSDASALLAQALKTVAQLGQYHDYHI